MTFVTQGHRIANAVTQGMILFINGNIILPVASVFNCEVFLMDF